jgi:hypothetical protein
MTRLAAWPTLPGIAARSLEPPYEKRIDFVDLSDARSFKRAGSQYLYAADGSEHYRVSFVGGACGAMHNTNQLSLESGDQANRARPDDSKPIAKNQACRINGIEKLGTDDYQRLTRKRRG